MLIVPQGYGELAIKTDAILISVGKLCSVGQPPGDEEGVCIRQGMSGLHKMLIGLASPFVMLIFLLLTRFMMLSLKPPSANTATKLDIRAGAPAPTEANVRRIDVTHGRVEFGSVQEPLLHTSSSLGEESIRNKTFDVSEANGDAMQVQEADPQEEGGSDKGRSVDSLESTTSSEARSRSWEPCNGQHAQQPEQMCRESDEDHSLLAAISCLLLFTYTSFASQAIRLLNCVQVGDMYVLRYAGEQSCDFSGWQAPGVLLVAVLVLLPFIPVIRWLLNHRWARLQWLRPLHSFMDRFASRGKLSYTVVEYAAQPFVPANWHWASVLVLQRLMTAMCAALSTTGVESSVTVALVSLIFLLLHLLAQPYRSNWVNILQGCANVCLVVLAILNSVSGAFLSTGFDPRTDGSPTLQHFQTALEVLMLLTLFPTPLVYIWHMSASSTCGCCRSREKKRRHEQASNSFRAKSPEIVQRREQWEDEGVTEPSVEGDRFAAYLLAGSADGESRNGEPRGVADVGHAETQPPDMYDVVQLEKQEKEHELVDMKQQLVEERQRHAEENAELLAEKEQQLAAKDAEKEQQLAAKDAEKEQQLAAKDAKIEQLAAKDAEKEQQLAAKDAEKEQQLAAKDAKIAQLLAEMASSGSKKSSEGAGAAGTGATKKGRNQYRTVEQPIQR
jgi:hypothetical protein